MIPITRPSLPPLEEYIKLLKDIWDSRMLSNFSKYAQMLEHKAQVYLGNDNLRVLSNCDAGLILALAVNGLPDGSGVVVPSYTFNSTVSAVIWNRLAPRFCDIDEETFNIDPSCAEAIVARGAKAIVATNIFGNPCDVDALRSIADSHDIPLIFDSAHALGSLYKGKKVGTLGDIEVFSLSGTKLVTSAEGGLISCSSAEVAEEIEYRRNYGFCFNYDSRYLGINAKISELNAALGCLTFDQIEQVIEHRQMLARRYRENLQGVNGISFQEIDPKNRSALKDMAIVCPQNRDALAMRLGDMGIQTKKYFYPAHRMKAFAPFADHALARTEELYEKVLCLPIFNEMTQQDVDLVCDIIEQFYKYPRS